MIKDENQAIVFNQHHPPNLLKILIVQPVERFHLVDHVDQKLQSPIFIP